MLESKYLGAIVIAICCLMTCCSSDEPTRIDKVDEEDDINAELFTSYDEMIAYSLTYPYSDWTEPWVMDMSKKDCHFLFPRHNYNIPKEGGTYRLYFGCIETVKIDAAFVWDTPEYYDSVAGYFAGYPYDNENKNWIDVKTRYYLNQYPDMPVFSIKMQKDPIYGPYVEMEFPKNETGDVRQMIYAPLTSYVYELAHNGLMSRAIYRFTQLSY